MKTIIYSIYLSSIAITSASAKSWLPAQYHHDHSDISHVLSSDMKNNLVEAMNSISFHNQKDSSPPKFLRRLEDSCTTEMHSLENQMSEAFDQYTDLSFDDFTFNSTSMEATLDMTSFPRKNATHIQFACENGEDAKGVFYLMDLKSECPEYTMIVKSIPQCKGLSCDDDSLLEFWKERGAFSFSSECELVEIKEHVPTCQEESMRVLKAMRPLYDTTSGPRTECTDDTSTKTTVCVTDGTVIPTENITIIQELCESYNVGGNLRFLDGTSSCQSGLDEWTVIKKMVGYPHCVPNICSDDDLFAYFDADPDCTLVELTDSRCEDELKLIAAADLIHDMNDLSQECLTIPGSRTICNVINPSNMSAFERTCENDNIGGQFYSANATVVCFDPKKDPSTLITEYRDFPICLGIHCDESGLISMLRKHFENENCVVLGLDNTSYGLTGMF
jgi:hypothetical protein